MQYEEDTPSFLRGLLKKVSIPPSPPKPKSSKILWSFFATKSDPKQAPIPPKQEEVKAPIQEEVENSEQNKEEAKVQSNLACQLTQVGGSPQQNWPDQ